jgi:hypothetical protein
MDTILLNDVDTTQLRKFTHTRTAIRCEPWAPTLGRVALAAHFDRQCRVQYRFHFVVSERLRLTHPDFLWHLHAPADKWVARD